MLFSVSREHKQFFESHHFIAFEELITPELAAQLKQKLDTLLTQRLQAHRAEPLQAGYGLSQQDESILRVCHKTAFAKLMGQLIDQSVIRFGFDQYITSSSTGSGAAPWNQTLSLTELSCLTPLAGALILPLTPACASSPAFSVPENPQHIGSGLFVSPSYPIPWAQWLQIPDLSLLLIAFASPRTLFCHKPQDPLSRELKKQGYALNDLLKEPFHPLLAKTHL